MTNISSCVLCPETGHYFTDNCYPCPEKLNCTKCDDPPHNKCSLCQEGLNLTNISSCVSCPSEGFYISDGCYKCPEGYDCKRCDGERNENCTSCFTGYLLENGRCVQPQDLEIEEKYFVKTSLEFHIKFFEILDKDSIAIENFKVEVKDVDKEIYELKISNIFYEENSKILRIKIKEITTTIEKAEGIITISSPSTTIKSKTQPKLKHLKSPKIKITPVKYLNPPIKDLESKSKSVSLGFSVLTIILSILSAEMAAELQKIYQLQAYLLFLNINHPKILRDFLKGFMMGNFLHLIPNPFPDGMFFNDQCDPMGRRFEEEEQECQILGNVGHVYFLLIALGFLRGGIELLMKVFGQFDKIKKICLKGRKKFNTQTAFYLVTGTHLEIYFSIFLSLKYYKEGNDVSNFNALISIFSVAALLFFIFYFYLMSRRAHETKETKRKILLQMYSKYLFLAEGVKSEPEFSRHYRIYRILKDPFLAFFVIILYEIPEIQIIFSALLMSIYVYKQYQRYPIEEKGKMTIEAMTNLCFVLINWSFLVIHLIGDKMKATSLNFFFGLPVIALIVIIMGVNILPDIWENLKKIKEKYCCKGKNGTNEQQAENIENSNNRLNRVRPAIINTRDVPVRPKNLGVEGDNNEEVAEKRVKDRKAQRDKKKKKNKQKNREEIKERENIEESFDEFLERG